MLRIIAENLTENAIRYARRAAAHLPALGRAGAAWAPSSSPPTTGSGSATRDLPRLFERFWRADAARASRGHRARARDRQARRQRRRQARSSLERARPGCEGALHVPRVVRAPRWLRLDRARRPARPQHRKREGAPFPAPPTVTSDESVALWRAPRGLAARSSSRPRDTERCRAPSRRARGSSRGTSRSRAPGRTSARRPSGPSRDLAQLGAVRRGLREHDVAVRRDRVGERSALRRVDDVELDPVGTRRPFGTAAGRTRRPPPRCP